MTPRILPVLLAVTMLVAAAPVPDVVIPGHRKVGRQLFVDPVPLARTHLVIAWGGAAGIPILLEEPRSLPHGGLPWEIIAAPKDCREAFDRALTALEQEGDFFAFEELFDGLPRSESLRPWEDVPWHSGAPERRIVRHRVIAVSGDEVLVEVDDPYPANGILDSDQGRLPVFLVLFLAGFGAVGLVAVRLKRSAPRARS